MDRNGKKPSLSERLTYIFTFRWFADLVDRLEAVPGIGCLLAPAVMLLGVIGAILGVGWLLRTLIRVNPILGGIVFFGGMDTYAYFACFRWKLRKPRLFWLCIAVTVAFPIVLLCMPLLIR